MVKTNPIKGKSKEQIEVILVSELKSLGQTKFDINLTVQARKIISNYGEAFPWEHFKFWFIQNKMKISGSTIFEYIVRDTGFEKGIKG